jgi:hypothetical protein
MAPADAAATYVVPVTIDSTGASDVTAALNSFFASVPNGSVIQFKPGGRYRVEGTLKLSERSGLTFEGGGATIVATTPGDRDRRHWAIVGGSRIVFRNLIVKGANPAAGTGDAAYNSTKEAQHGFDFQGVAGVELDRVTVTDVYGDFVYLGKKVVTGGAWTSGVRIHDSHFERNGRQGISVTGAQDVVIERNWIGQTRRATFDLEPNGEGWGMRRVSIINNQVGPGRLNFVSGHGGPSPVEDVTISGNKLTGKAMNMSFSAPAGTRRARIRVIDNVSDTGYGNTGGAAIYFARIDGIEVRGNVQRLQAGRNMAGVETSESCNAVVQGNTFSGAATDARIGAFTCAPTPTPAPSGTIAN